MTILIVDDEIHSRRMLNHVLESSKHTVGCHGMSDRRLFPNSFSKPLCFWLMTPLEGYGSGSGVGNRKFRGSSR